MKRIIVQSSQAQCQGRLAAAPVLPPGTRLLLVAYRLRLPWRPRGTPSFLLAACPTRSQAMS